MRARIVADLGLGHVRLSDPAEASAPSLAAVYGPAEGMSPLREAIASWVGVSAGEVAVTTGASLGLVATLATLDRPGSILCPRPYYPAYPRIARELGFEVVFYELHPRRDWLPCTEELCSLARADTRALLWNFPSNPAGSMPSKELVADLARLVEARGFLVISDEVYADFVFDDCASLDLRDFLPAASVVRLRSFSKLFGIPGERVGYVVAAPDRRQAIARAHWSFAMCPPASGQTLALAALRADPAARIACHRRLLQEHRSRALAALASSPRLGVHPPAAGIFCWIEVRKSPLASEALAQALAREGVVTVPGAAFGVAEPTYLRASFAVPPQELDAGFHALVAYCNSL